MENFFNYVAPEEDSHWRENVFASCTDNGDQADVTNEDMHKDEDKHKDEDMHKDFFCETCPKQFLTKTLLQLHRKTHVIVESKCEEQECDKDFLTNKD